MTINLQAAVKHVPSHHLQLVALASLKCINKYNYNSLVSNIEQILITTKSPFRYPCPLVVCYKGFY